MRSSKPVLFQKCLRWNILNWTVEDWIRNLHSEKLTFRIGSNICEQTPFWEGLCRKEQHTIEEFVEFCRDDDRVKKEWWYFDYKHLAEHLIDNQEILRSISWSEVGFPERDSKNSTLWIGSPGAHTPCHYDSYGCNIVAQVLGRKRWFLFPPDETTRLKPTRVPYEESSVYSDINFACYKRFQDEKFDTCYAVDLNPGDVLFIPPKWWHYVENLTLAVSVNSWIPMKPDDDISRLDEALVKYFISSTIHGMPKDIKKGLLNPNEMDLEFSVIHLDIIKFCKQKIHQNKKESTPVPQPLDDTSGQNNFTAHVHKYNFLRKTTLSEMIDMAAACHECCDLKFSSSDSCCDSSSNNDADLNNLMSSVINAFSHPDIISQIRNKLLR